MGKRATIGLLAAFATTVSLVVVPGVYAAPDSPSPKASGVHIAYTFCHRTGSEKNPFVFVTADDAAWAEAHHAGSEPAHPVKNGNDDILVGIDLVDPPRGPAGTVDECDPKKGDPKGKDGGE
jgi:hypothetical protein